MYMHAKDLDSEPFMDPVSLLNCLNANLRKASRVLLSLYMDEMRTSGLSGTQFTLLSTIAGFSEATINDLARNLAMDQTTVTRNVNLLKRKSYVVVVPGEDRRTRIVSLTAQGLEAIQKAKPMWLAAQTKIWDQLGPEKAKQLLEITKAISELTETE